MDGIFLFPQYLDLLFPRSLNAAESQKRQGILDTIPQIDISTAEKREFTAQGVSLPLKRLSGLKHLSFDTPSPTLATAMDLDDSLLLTRKEGDAKRSWNIMGSAGGVGVIGDKAGMGGVSEIGGIGDSVQIARRRAREQEGMSVRQLSRLWRYEGGKRIVEKGVSGVNGVGNAIRVAARQREKDGVEMKENGNTRNQGKWERAMEREREREVSGALEMGTVHGVM